MKDPLKRFPIWLIQEVNRLLFEYANMRRVTLSYMFSKDRYNVIASEGRRHVHSWLAANIVQDPGKKPRFALRTDKSKWSALSPASIGLLLNCDRTAIYNFRKQT